MEMREVSRMEALNAFFGKVSIEEIKALTPADRRELAELAAKELGVAIKADPVAA